MFLAKFGYIKKSDILELIFSQEIHYQETDFSV